MPILNLDSVGIVIFIVIAAFFYKRAWFFSFYSFFKFLIVLAISIALSLLIASKNTYHLPLTNLQLSLVIEAFVFTILWRFISFKKFFFAATDSVFSINRFVFIHHLDRVLNIFPSVVASFFVSFFLFTIALTVATSNPALQSDIESSRIVKPVFYKIYLASLSFNNFGLFQNVAYKLVPTINFGAINKIANQQAIDSFAQKVNSQRATAGLAPNPVIQAGNMQAFTPPASITPAPNTQNNTPTDTPTPHPFFQFSPTSTPIPPTQQPNPTMAYGQVIVVTATPRPIQYIPPQQPTSTPYIFPTRTPIIFPTPTPYIQPTQVPIQIPTPTPQPAQIPILSAPAPNISQAEQDIFRLTNIQRSQNGLAPFAWSDALAAVARAHSQDMVTRNFFDHVNPDGLDPFQRMQIGGISYTAAAENIAGGPTADIIVTNWMNSPGHRANILNPSLGKLGVGIAISPQYGLMATQDFTN